MGNFRYLLMIAIAAVTVFASCSKDEDDDKNDPNADPREAIVGSYNVTANIMELNFSNTGNGGLDTTITDNASYVLTISIPPASDSLPSDYVLVRNIANTFLNEDIQSSITNDVMVLNVNDEHNSELAGSAVFSGNTFTASFNYYDYNAYRTYFTISATKRN